MTEDQLQQIIVTYYRNNYQINRKGLIFSIPNGGARNVIEAKKLKATGTLSGVSDLIVITENGELIFFELKIEKGIQSETQKDFESRVIELGYRYELVRSLEDFIKRL